MSVKKSKISLVYIVILTLLLVGLVPVLLTGWFLSERSARELRAVENRYQIQLVHEKASQIQIFGNRYLGLVNGLTEALALSGDQAIFSRAATDETLEKLLRENDDLLAVRVAPQSGEPMVLYRPDVITRAEVDGIADSAVFKQGGGTSMDAPRTLEGSGLTVMTLVNTVIAQGRPLATITAVVSLKNISRSVVGMAPTKEGELWKAGLPIIFVVDRNGNTVFHPDEDLVWNQSSLTHLKIVQEWQEANLQIQSGLVPFSAEFDGRNYEMIGAYSTVVLGNDLVFGIITMQDEAKALASVGEMRFQTWLISIVFALLALVIGSVAARSLTAPILRLAVAAKRISDGDLSTRVDARGFTEIGTLGRSFNKMSDKLEEHIAKLAKAAKENRELFVGTVKALAAAIDGKDKYTRGHSERVARISVAIGREMGLNEDELEALRISALLHDIGKIAIDDNILKKPAALTKEEFEIMKTHPQKGYKIMSQIPAMKDFLPGMYMHHEMVNGEGYPQGLSDDQIPLQAKIVSVADTFDAMTIDRPYSKGMLLPEALSSIKSLVGTRYDAAVVEALVRGCESGEIGRGVVKFMAERHDTVNSRELGKVTPTNGQAAPSANLKHKGNTENIPLA